LYEFYERTIILKNPSNSLQCEKSTKTPMHISYEGRGL